MPGVKHKREVNTEEPGGTQHTYPHQVQPPLQDAETDVSAMSQEMGRVAYTGEDLQGFLRPLEVWG